MTANYYKDAQRKGIKEYNRMIVKGKYPYLPILDMILKNQEDSAINEVPLGIIQVPSHLIVGTKTSGRAQTFACNYMPLLQPGSEFASKWQQLCDSHLEEGIRDPIKVFEYYNRYYVLEGNKRVSVLKYFGAVSIMADVIRILPGNQESDLFGLYSELMEFQKRTGVYFLEFSTKGSYKELLQLIDADNESAEWDDDKRQTLSSLYYRFQRVFNSLTDKYPDITTADAFLAYIKIYDYSVLPDTSDILLSEHLRKLVKELSLVSEEDSVELSSYPSEVKSNIFKQVINSATTVPKHIAFIHDKNAEVSGWVNSHELGRNSVQEALGDRIQTKSYFNACDSDPHEAINKAIEDGSNIIFTTSPKLLQACLQASVDHPEIIFLNCAINKPHLNVRIYGARMYEAKFILGAVAASVSKGSDLGYVCDYPIYGHIAGINAFALGAKMINPDIKVHLEWSAIAGIQGAVNNLKKKGVSIISSLEFVPQGEEEYNFYGLFAIENDKQVSLAVPLWQWDVYYKELIERILNGSFRHDTDKSSKAINYYWGISADVIDILYGDKLPYSSKKLGIFLKEAIRSGDCRPFMGPIVTQDGSTVEDCEHKLTLDEIVVMEYLVDNVVGRIPKYEEFSADMQETIDVLGINSVKKNS